MQSLERILITLSCCRVYIINSKRDQETPFETVVITQQAGTQFLLSCNSKGIPIMRWNWAPTTLYSVSYCDLSFFPNEWQGREVPYCFLHVVPVGQMSPQSPVSYHLIYCWYSGTSPGFPSMFSKISTYTPIYTNTQLSCHSKWLTVSACLMVKSQLIHGTANVNVYMAPSAQLFLPLAQCWGHCLQILSDQSRNGRVNCFPMKKSG